MSSPNAIKSIKRAVRSGLDDLLYLLAIVAIVILANAILKNEGRARIDLTDEGLYTLTPASAELVRSLPQPVQVKAFFSEGLQAPEHNLAQRVEDLLAEYAAASDGKFSFEMITPDDESTEDEELAKGFGIDKVAVGQRDKNQIGLRLVYKGIAFVYGDKQEVIAEVKAGDNLEYEITKTLMNLIYDKPHKIGVLQGFGGAGADEQFIGSLQSAFGEIYGKLIEAQGVDLATATSIPDDIDALLILNVQEPVSDAAKFAIDQFLMKGKAVALFQSPSLADPRMPQMPFRTPIVHNLGDLFEKYGVKLRNDLVIDRERNMVGLELTSRGIAQVSIPTLPMLTGINRESILTKNIDTMVFPFTGSIELTDVADGPGLSVDRLILTADTAVSREAVGDLKWDTLMKPGENELEGPLLVAVAVAGTLPSAYPNGAPAGVTPAGELITKANADARILVVSNGEFMFANPRIGYGDDVARFGVLFFLNTMDWLVQDEALIRIRSKGVPRMLEPVDTETQRLLQVANIGVIPVSVALIGLIVWGFRSWRRLRIHASFSGRSTAGR